MKNKRADFTIVLLVIMVLVLTAGALFIFNINTNKIGVKIVGARVLDEVYIIENEINFNLNRIMGKAIIGIDKQGDVVEIKQQFIVNFKSEFSEINIVVAFVAPANESGGNGFTKSSTP